MSDFPIQSGDFSYAFDFQTKTGNASWTFSLGYESGTSSLFSSPYQVQNISGLSGISQSAARSDSYLLLGNSTGNVVEVYQNLYLQNTQKANEYVKTNRLTGDGLSDVSGFGFSVAGLEGIGIVGAPDYKSGIGATFVFSYWLTGAGGATGTGNWSQLGYTTGTEISGNYGHSVAVIKDNTTQIVGAGAPYENSGSGAIYLYDQSSLSPIAKLTPTGSDVTNFGRTVGFAEAQSLKYVFGACEYGGTGQIWIYKQQAARSSSYEYYQTLSSDKGSSGDLYGYAIRSEGNDVLVGAPNVWGSGRAYYYDFDDITAQFTQRQEIYPADLGASHNFGKNVDLWLTNAIITSDSLSGKAYVYDKSGDLWGQASIISGDLNTVSGSFGGDISGGHNTLVHDNVIIVGTNNEPYTYYFTTGQLSTAQYTGLALSGSGGKLYDSENNFIYGYNTEDQCSISGNVFTGAFHNIFVNGNLCNSRCARSVGVGSTGALNAWTVAGTGDLFYYGLTISSDG